MSADLSERRRRIASALRDLRQHVERELGEILQELHALELLEAGEPRAGCPR